MRTITRFIEYKAIIELKSGKKLTLKLLLPNDYYKPLETINVNIINHLHSNGHARREVERIKLETILVDNGEEF